MAAISDAHPLSHVLFATAEALYHTTQSLGRDNRVDTTRRPIADDSSVMRGALGAGERLSSMEHDARDTVEDEHSECECPDSE